MVKGNKAMDILKSALAERKAKAQKVMAETGQKWVRRSVLEEQRVAEYFEHQQREEEKQKADEEMRLQQLNEHLSRRLGKEKEPEKVIPAHILNDALLGDDDAEPPVNVAEIMERLREMAQPITLFGETDMQRYKRMRQVEKEVDEGKKNPDLVMLENLHQSQMQQMIQDEEDKAAKADDEDDELEGGEGKEEEAAESDKSDEEEAAAGNGGAQASTDEPQKEQQAQETAEDAAPAAGSSKKKDEVDDIQVEVDVNLMDKCDFIRAWARKALKAWEKELAEKPEEDKKKAIVKTEIAQHRQVRRDVRPLQKRLRLYIMEEWLLDKIYNIVKQASEREYRNAAEAYLDLSIGKAAWPVGIGCGGSMLMEDAIGLHDRFNRMANVKDIAFALNDDVTRKFVQALKRLMNVSQRYWPPDDPSKA